MEPTEEKTTCIYTLSAVKAQPEDSGVWKCEVTNNHGAASATCTVRVLDVAEDVPEQAELPRFVKTLENVVISGENDIDFRCTTNPDEVLNVTWYRNDIPIVGYNPGMERYYVTSEEGVQKLEIKRTRPRDVGVYKCKISNNMGWTSCDAKLFVEDPSGKMDVIQYTREHEYKIVDSIKSRKALETIDRGFNETDLLLSSFCDTETIQKFMIKWQSDNEKTLYFPIHLKNKCSVEGSLAVLSCLMKGTSFVDDIRWFKNNNEIFEGVKYYIKSLQGILSLTIPQTEVTDTGNYTCMVRNRQGKIYTSCYLQIEPRLETTNEVPMKPLFVKPMKRLTVNEGEIINFRVTVKGYPPPGYKWFKDGLEIHDSERVRTEVLPKGVAELTITHSTVRDIGLYTCEAHNMAGRAQSMVRVSVRDKFELELWTGRDLNGVMVETGGKHEMNGEIERKELAIPTYTQQIESKLSDRVPDFAMHLPTSMSIHSKQRFTLEIRCGGHPKPNVRWYKDGLVLFEGTRYNLLSVGDWFGLEISNPNPKDAGTYTVKLNNDAGCVESSCTVDMPLPVSRERSIQTTTESVEDLSQVIAGHAAPRAELEDSVFKIADLVPSFHLCNTEADWTTCIDKEVEVIDADEAPSFPHALPAKLTIHETGEHIHLECQIRGEPMPQIVWLKDDNDLEDGPNISLSMDPKTRIASLIVDNVTAGDSGHYSCVAYGECGGHATTSADVQILAVKDMGDDSPDGAKKSVPEFKVKLSDTEAHQGGEVKLECVAEGFPLPKVKWYKNDTPIKPTIGKYTITSSVEGFHSLIIASMHVSDSDCYKCEAVNECGAESSTAHIVVQEQCEVGENAGDAPCFEDPLHNLTVEAGHTASFKCVAKGTPAPTLSWQKDGTNLISGDRVTITCIGNVGTLTIEGTVLEDAGLYVCTAESTLGKVESCASIKVNENVDEVSEVKQQKRVIEATTDVQIQKNAKENTPEVKLIEDTGSVVTEIDTIQTEEITNIKTSLESSDVGVLVDYKRRPRFVLPPLSQWSMVDSPLNLEVEVTKGPNLKVNWYHNDKLVVADDRITIVVQDGER